MTPDTRGHVWKLDERGWVDKYAMESDPHSGPVCVVCGYSYCTGCQRGPDEDCPGVLGVAQRKLADLEAEHARLTARLAALPAAIASQRADVARLFASQCSLSHLEGPKR
jgi:predicted Fe-S protein YdhL (DUF1289 family)